MRAILPAVLAFACTPVCPNGDCPSDRDPIDRGNGWNDPMGEGRIYVISSITIAMAEKGFDLDGRCVQDRCIDNKLSTLQGLNTEIGNNHSTGNGRTLIELAGADTLETDDPSATLKTYEALDLTYPGMPFPFDDFMSCDPGCARFYVTERSVAGDQARWRAPALIDDGVIRDAGRGSLAFVLPLNQGAIVVSLERPRFEAVWVSELRKIELTLAGAVPAQELAEILNPQCVGSGACRAEDPSLLDFLVSRSIQPDIDLDDDGLETFRFDADVGRVGLCFDGCVEGCPHDLPIAPVDVDAPWTCVNAASVGDAYSLTLTLVATPAFIRGVR